ncbi:hypothetical protein [Roseibium litorale]|uniref:Uncharacterized protein n=1 Tax=Roseibium litorale TaxID=2803841 RepID=A0ABR9CNV8_9HYPH|nr:hypothetical protein [Roseibium litorale]MBD8892531.1 hypothetical protein [Roseibium litorale]
MKLRFYLPAFLKTILAVAFVVAGGSFSHSFAERSHGHEHEVAASDGHSHGQTAATADQLVVDHETVHCGAYLLALTSDDEMRLPALADDMTADCFVSGASRTAKIDPPPPRPVSLSI